MDDMFISALEAALTKGDIQKSIELLRTWLASAPPGAPEELLRTCAQGIRPKLVLLMRDLLSRYPSTLLGAPVLLFARPDDEDLARPSPNLVLPFPTREVAQPCADLHFLGWLPLSAQLPIPQPFRPEHYLSSVPWHRPVSVIALFRSHPEVFDFESLELPNRWWGELFRPVRASIQLAARLLLPYPDALEAGGIMQAYANGEEPPARKYFLSDAGWSWASNEGVLFNETCRHLYLGDS